MAPDQEIVDRAAKAYMELMGGEDKAKPWIDALRTGLENALVLYPITKSPFIKRYVTATSNLPLPTDKQISDFAEYLSGIGHFSPYSWYKNCGTMEFLVFLDKFPQHMMKGKSLIEITDEVSEQFYQHHPLTTKDFINKFGYLGASQILYGYFREYGMVGRPGPHFFPQYIGAETDDGKIEPLMVTDKEDVSKTVNIPPEFFALNQRMKCNHVNPDAIAASLVSMRELVSASRTLLAQK
jgi:hypothetical protein